MNKTKKQNIKKIYELVDQFNHPIIKDIENKYEIDLRQRLLKFAVDTLKLLMKLPNKREFDVIKYQLSKSATSVGANFEEAQSSSDKEFVQKLRIALREANESNYWYKIIDELKVLDTDEHKRLSKESQEIGLILGSIVSKLNKKIYR